MEKNQLFALLKAKAKQYGFDKDEMGEVVDALLQNSQLTDEATEEDWNAQIDAVLPYLGVGQKMANRLSKAQKKVEEPLKPAKKKTDGEGDEGDEDVKGKGSKADEGADNAMMALIKAMKDEITALREETASFKADKVAESRKQRLAKIIDVESVFGKSTLSTFDRLKFDTDDDFDNYLGEVEEVAKSLKMDANSKKLDTLGKKGDGGVKKTKDNLATDQEIDALVDKM